MTYQEASQAAQKAADTTGFDHGVEKIGSEYRFWILPPKGRRFGFELKCEVRYCSDLNKCRPGHGPC